jgi:hypothetical protein
MEGQSESAGRDELVRDIQAVAEGARPREEPRQWTKQERQAFRRFYDRFIRRVYAYCKRTMDGQLPSNTTLVDFTSRVFQRLSRDLHRLKLSATASIEDIERLVLAFFHRQAEWALADVREEEEPDEVPPEFLDAARTRGRWRGQPPSSKYLQGKNRLRLLFAGLDDKDRDILHTSFSHVDLVTGKFTLPESERDRLCRDWKFASPNALSQYRKRKIAQLKTALSDVA